MSFELMQLLTKKTKMSIQIYHKPNCSKSRESFQLLKKEGIDFETILYMQDVPTREELKVLLKKLGIKAEQLIRKTEKIYSEKYKDQKMSSERWLTAMIKYPQLIQRPIIIKGDKAVIGRPIELVVELLDL